MGGNPPPPLKPPRPRCARGYRRDAANVWGGLSRLRAKRGLGRLGGLPPIKANVVPYRGIIPVTIIGLGAVSIESAGARLIDELLMRGEHFFVVLTLSETVE